jgi:hypothetical protein
VRVLLPYLGENFVEAGEGPLERGQIDLGAIEQVLQPGRRVAPFLDERNQRPADPLPIAISSRGEGSRWGTLVRNAAF